MPADTIAAQAVQAVQSKTGEPSQTPAPVASETLIRNEADKQTPDPRMDALAKKERQLHKLRKEVEAEKASWKQRISEYETGYVPKAKLSEDPFGVLNEAGVTYDHLTEKLLSAPNMNDPAIRALMGKIKALEDKHSQAERQATEQAEKQYSDAIAGITTEVQQLVDSSEEYEMIKATGLHEAVTEYIEQKYHTDGKLIDTHEACKVIEEYLLNEAQRLASTKKMQARLKPAPVSAEAPKQSLDTPNQLKTLTNAVSTTPTKRLSEKERVARAMAAFRGELK